jgi:hypothetical protein
MFIFDRPPFQFDQQHALRPIGKQEVDPPSVQDFLPTCQLEAIFDKLRILGEEVFQVLFGRHIEYMDSTNPPSLIFNPKSLQAGEGSNSP